VCLNGVGDAEDWHRGIVAAKRSAGILVFRRTSGQLEVLLGHMGGPFWQRKDVGGWSMPKGEIDPDEEPIAAAQREFTEELGIAVPDGYLTELGEITQSGGKVVTAWAVESDLNPDSAVFGTFEMEWPKGSGQLSEFPELDRLEWFDLNVASLKVVAGQREFLIRLAERAMMGS
jgi:predicted NUDIX family NTP pyrophosphohydrolase